MKLVKVQREILSNAAASFAKHGVEKPIHVMSVNAKNNIDNFSKSYATYCKKMEKLASQTVFLLAATFCGLNFHWESTLKFFYDFALKVQPNGYQISDLGRGPSATRSRTTQVQNKSRMTPQVA